MESTRFFWLGMGVFVFVLAGLTVWTRLSVVNTSYKISQIDRSLQTSHKKLDRLEVEIARLRSPFHLEKVAARFQLKRPNRTQIVHLHPSK